MKLLNKSLSYWLRVIHRDLGFLMVGLCLVYGVSGFLLNHMDGKDPAFKTTETKVELKKGMDADEITAEWNADSELPHLKKVLKIDDEHFRIMLEGGVGIYNSLTGVTEYETHEKNENGRNRIRQERKWYEMQVHEYQKPASKPYRSDCP